MFWFLEFADWQSDALSRISKHDLAGFGQADRTLGASLCWYDDRMRYIRTVIESCGSAR
jgi:hypothetical protein